MSFSPDSRVLVTLVAAIAVAGCGSPSIGPGEPGVDASTDACLGTHAAGTKGEVPSVHRATAVACSPSTRGPLPPASGLSSCTTDSDCAADGGTLFDHCLHGVCSFDQCLTDSDCANGVCGCASDYYGGVGYHANLCVPANCHTDADCGLGGFCSPSLGHCGSYEGFYCHGGSDTCVNETTDCTSCG